MILFVTQLLADCTAYIHANVLLCHSIVLLATTELSVFILIWLVIFKRVHRLLMCCIITLCCVDLNYSLTRLTVYIFFLHCDTCASWVSQFLLACGHYLRIKQQRLSSTQKGKLTRCCWNSQ